MYTEVKKKKKALMPSHVGVVQDSLNLLVSNSLVEIFIIVPFPGDLQRYTMSARVFLSILHKTKE